MLLNFFKKRKFLHLKKKTNHFLTNKIPSNLLFFSRQGVNFLLFDIRKPCLCIRIRGIVIIITGSSIHIHDPSIILVLCPKQRSTKAAHNNTYPNKASQDSHSQSNGHYDNVCQNESIKTPAIFILAICVT